MRKNSYDFTEPIRQSKVAILMIIWKYYKLILRQIIPLILIIFVGGQGERWKMYLIYGSVILAVLSMGVAIIAYFRFYFRISDEELIVQKGILQKQRTSIPFERIQTINLEQNLVHQFFKVVKVEVDTAGSSQNEFEFDALSKDMAEQLRSIILARKSAVQKSESSLDDSETGQLSSEEIKKTILTISVPQLLRIGITENHIKSGLLILVAFFWLYDNLNEAGIDVVDYGDELDLSPTFTIISFLAIIFIVTSILISLIRTVLTHYNLRFIRTDKGFRVEQGLLTRKNTAALDHKIQMISFSDNLLKKLFGYKDLFLKQASSITVSAKKSIKIPGCTISNIEAVTGDLYDDSFLKRMVFSSVDHRYFWRRAIYATLIALPIIAGSIYWSQMQTLLITTAILFYLILVFWLEYRKTKYAFNEEMIAVRGGTFGDSTTILPVFKIQSLGISQNLFQRRRNLATVIIYTASGGTSIPYIAKGTAEKIVDYLLYRVETDTRPWM